ncbi:hypothetical protein, partial [Klebsiella pneumoniae]|uniref:hypothetical protein n=1 Tax=Klebsiella pneumoniae TaxID=573 RepID=UPI00163D536B
AQPATVRFEQMHHPEVHLGFLTRPAFHAPDTLWLTRSKLLDESLNTVISPFKAMLSLQILMDAPGMQSHLKLLPNHIPIAFT